MTEQQESVRNVYIIQQASTVKDVFLVTMVMP